VIKHEAEWKEDKEKEVFDIGRELKYLTEEKEWHRT